MESPTLKPKTKQLPTTKPTRVIDPGIAALRKEHNEAVRALKDQRRSSAVLKTILDKRLAQLTNSHKEHLYDHLKQIVTPALPIK